MYIPFHVLRSKMDLFHVERYTFDEKDGVGQDNTELEKERLKILNDRIRKRKKEQDGIFDGPTGSNVDLKEGKDGDLMSHKRRKKKKRKASTDDDKGNKDDENAVEQKTPVKLKLIENKKIKDKQISKNDTKNGHDILLENLSGPEGTKNAFADVKGAQKLKKRGKTIKELSSNIETNANSDYENDIEENLKASIIDNAQLLIENEMSNIEHDDKNVIIPEDGEYFPVLGSFDQKKERAAVKRTLPKWISHPMLMSADITKGSISLNKAAYLEDFLMDKLRKQNIENLFPVQAMFIPYLLSQIGKGTVFGLGGLTPSDICVSAPTGSGKTLAYVLPIIQILSHCLVRRLQAIVILPSKDLAAQIKAVISNYIGGTHIRVGLAAGMKSFQQEQEQIIGSKQNGLVNGVDILVCTPGRLVDHIDNTDGFTLEHLRFLIIDEADRLLGQSYHNWLEKIFEAAYRSKSNGINESNVATFRSRSQFSSPSSVDRGELPLQKLLFSATMTYNPEKLAPLQLFRPVLFTSSGKIQEGRVSATNNNGEEESNTERYILPESLTEKMTICKQGEKPLVVVYLMKTLEYRRVLCFTGSIEATHRLFLLVKAFDIRVAEFSSLLNQSQRKGILRDFKSGEIDLLICSDAMSRGMDIDDVRCVISYDPPVNIKTYVHRVGRTARAGQTGMALTILSAKEVYHFKKIIRNGKRTTLPKLNVTSKDLEPLVDQYENALVSLKDTVSSERTHAHRKRST